MAHAQQPDIAGKILGFFVIAALGMTGVYFISDRLHATFAPEQHAAARAEYESKRDTEIAASEQAQQKERERRKATAQAAAQEERAYTDAKQALNSVKATLLDPGSAQFKDVWAVRATYAGATSTFACGTVNAKNLYGGYIGYEPFVAIGSTVLTPEQNIFPQVFNQVCLDGEKLFPVQK